MTKSSTKPTCNPQTSGHPAVAAHPQMVQLVKSLDQLSTADGTPIDVYELRVNEIDEAGLSTWARWFREHYCLDAEIDILREGTGKSRTEYLKDLVFPDTAQGLDSATRAGDFAEILIADLLEAKLGYWVPRTRYADKQVRNESPRGSDILGFKFSRNDEHPTPQDSLIAAESKAQLSGTSASDKLQEAVQHSSKDVLRLAEALNAAKRRLLKSGNVHLANRVRRFQDWMTHPYIRDSGAAAVFLRVCLQSRTRS
jgi:hypothetical protein